MAKVAIGRFHLWQRSNYSSLMNSCFYGRVVYLTFLVVFARFIVKFVFYQLLHVPEIWGFRVLLLSLCLLQRFETSLFVLFDLSYPSLNFNTLRSPLHQNLVIFLFDKPSKNFHHSIHMLLQIPHSLTSVHLVLKIDDFAVECEIFDSVAHL